MLFDRGFRRIQVQFHASQRLLERAICLAQVEIPNLHHQAAGIVVGTRVQQEKSVGSLGGAELCKGRSPGCVQKYREATCPSEASQVGKGSDQSAKIRHFLGRQPDPIPCPEKHSGQLRFFLHCIHRQKRSKQRIMGRPQRVGRESLRGEAQSRKGTSKSHEQKVYATTTRSVYTGGYSWQEQSLAFRNALGDLPLCFWASICWIMFRALWPPTARCSVCLA